MTFPSSPVTTRRILGLAVPALGALAAEPLYVLVDTAVVGHLGSVPLAGLAVAGGFLSNSTWLVNFLSYGTTQRAARQFGAGDRTAAIRTGVQATWLALVVGVLAVVLLQLVAGPVAGLLSGSPAQRDAAVSWLRIAACGAPVILVSLAGQGWMRGVHDTRRPLVFLISANIASAIASPILVYGLDLGLEGSAIANVAAQAIAAGLFLRALLGEGVSLAPDPAAMRAHLAVGRDLMVRTIAMEAAFLSATAVASRMGTTSAAAHQIGLQLWVFLALVLDALAIAAQQLIGTTLGAGDRDGARAIASRITVFGAIAGGIFCVLLLAGYGVVPRLFTSDPGVIDRTHAAWWWFAAMQPVAGALFAIDGILIGAGDNAFMRNVSIGAALLGFIPMSFLALELHLGLGGVWAGLMVFLLARFVPCLIRVRRGAWATVGAPGLRPVAG